MCLYFDLLPFFQMSGLRYYYFLVSYSYIGKGYRYVLTLNLCFLYFDLFCLSTGVCTYKMVSVSGYLKRYFLLGWRVLPCQSIITLIFLYEFYVYVFLHFDLLLISGLLSYDLVVGLFQGTA